MSRATKILGRFPAHMEAAKRGKLLGDVVAALARDLDVQSAQLGAIRRAHRIREAETRGDLMRLAALHGIRARELDLLDIRLDLAAERAVALADADAAGRTAALADLLALFALALPENPLDAVTPDDAPADAEQAAAEAAQRLAAMVQALTTPRARRRAMADRVVAVCANHGLGNGTIRAVMTAAANALDLDLGTIVHGPERYLHAAPATDRLRLVPPADTGLAPLAQLIDIVGLEENPLRRAERAPEAFVHGELFEFFRKGFEPAALEITVTAELDRTVGPMVVNRDQGRGVGFAATVPAGETLTLTETGRAMLGTSDMTAFAYGFEGAVFADADAPRASDACFDEAIFVTTTPPGALDREAVYPHAGVSLPMPEIGIGATAMAFFVQEGHFADGAAEGGARIPTPRSQAGLFAGGDAPLGSVFAPGPDEVRQPAARVGFAWHERQAYRAHILIPERFRALVPDTEADPEMTAVTTRVLQAVERVRPVGVALECAFIDDRWTLGSGILSEAAADGSTDPVAALIGGTMLWPSPDDTAPPDEPA